MQTANIMLALGGDAGTLVPKDNVTASEIAVLQLIHGNSAVTDVEPTGTVQRSNRDELQRLREIYGHAKVTDMDGSPAPVLNVLFPGAGARAIEKLEDLEIAPEFYKAKERAKPNDKADGDDGDKSIDDMTKNELVAYAKQHDIEVDGEAKKADVLEAIKKAETAGAGSGETDEELFG